ncbi:hypothetical protein PCC9214_02093 [Planktothrix tepida]|uniref:Uncharacterized protein n=2 Tax=Planktothrix TaxID=54304 RepID=A0A1J1LKC2_9CYAN|nr:MULTISPECIES: hypothetical protein [Planktothrix]CAD5943643.1 hypothetical protein PCC9214_02093 [Planktothrix tepida]CAD5967589.1 hypothetical protein NO713_03605 [Planktothrix pseudagardhii]CUR32943.1 conserved membrane hypothetical protein [Planktothrix tepida PCC 9214]
MLKKTLQNNCTVDHNLKRSDRVNLNSSSNFTATERLESLKGGLLAGFCVGLTHILLSSLNLWLWGQPINVWFSVPIAGVSGFLFGVTYRYIIRGDNNPQLKLGGIFAFGLVRGLAEIDIQLKTQTSLEQIVIVAGESLLLFGIAGLILDKALQKGWIKPFC